MLRGQKYDPAIEPLSRKQACHRKEPVSSTCPPFMPLQIALSQGGLSDVVAFKVDFHCRVILYAR